MARYHMNSKGEPGVCRANLSCPFGGLADHFSTKEEAREAFEANHGVWDPKPGKLTMSNSERIAGAAQLRDTSWARGAAKREGEAIRSQALGRVIAQNMAKAEAAKTPGQQEADNMARAEGVAEGVLRIQEERDVSRKYAAEFGIDESELYMRVTGAPAWVDSFSAEGKKASKKWDATMSKLVDEPDARLTPAGYVVKEVPLDATYPRAVMAFGQGRDANNEIYSVKTVVPLDGPLTDKRRLVIGRVTWEQSGKDLATWDKADEKERLRWCNTHMGRYTDVRINNVDGRIGYTTDSSGGGSHPSEQWQIFEV